MNKVILMGRLTRDPEVRYSQGAEAKAVCSYTIAVNRSFKREGEPDADFIDLVSFGSRGEFAGKYFKKGMMVAVCGELRINSYTDKDGNKRWSTKVYVTDQEFAERRQNNDGGSGYTPNNGNNSHNGHNGYAQAPNNNQYAPANPTGMPQAAIPPAPQNGAPQGMPQYGAQQTMQQYPDLPNDGFMPTGGFMPVDSEEDLPF